MVQAPSLPRVLIFALTSCTCLYTVTSQVTVTFKQKYFTDATLLCDETALQLPYTSFLKYWILPDGRILQWLQNPDTKYQVGAAPGFNLTISHVDDADFGWYYCIILWDNYIYLTNSIKVGLNVDGADFSDLFDGYKANAMIGAIAASGTGVLLGLACLVYWCRYSDVNTRNDENKEKRTKEKKKTKLSQTASDSVSKKEVKSEKMEDEDTEHEVIYILDKTVNAYGDNTESQAESVVSTSTIGYNGKVKGLHHELKKRCQGRADETDQRQTTTIPTSLPPPPPPAPPLPLPNRNSNSARMIEELQDTYDKIPQRRSDSSMLLVHGGNAAENSPPEKVDFRKNDDSSEVCVNSVFEEDIYMNGTSAAKNPGIGVIESYNFQELLADEYI